MRTLADRLAALSPQQRQALALRLRREGLALPRRPLVRRPATEPAVLSFAQERMWTLDQLDPGSPAYNIHSAFRLRGLLRPAALAAGLARIVERHEVLRTGVVSDAGRPRPRLAPAGKPALPTVDLSSLPAAAGQERLSALNSRAASRPVRLDQPPLLRALLLRLGRAEHVLLLTVHHIAFDGWSLGVLVQELRALYASAVQQQPAALPPLELQYADFAAWQRAGLAAGELAPQVDYWRRRLADLPNELVLRADRPRPPRQSSRGRRRRWWWPLALNQATARLAEVSGNATPFALLAAAVAALCWRVSGERDFCLGTPIANRNHSAIEGLIGFFVNTLPIRIEIAGDPPFCDFLASVWQQLVAAYAHQDLPFERLVAELNLPRDPGRTPLFQVMVALQNAPLGRLEVEGLELAPEHFDNGTAKLDLLIDAVELDGGLEVWLEFSTDLFDSSSMTRFAGGLRSLLAGAITGPETPLSALPLLGAAERHQLVTEWGGAGLAFASDTSLGERFSRVAAECTEAVALVEGESQWSYGALAGRAGALASALAERGAGGDQRVLLVAPRSSELVVGVLGILRAGAAYVPIDPAYPRERQEFLLADAGATALVTAGSWELEPPRGLPWLRLEELRSGGGAGGGGAEADHLAYVIYTSGSTGTPKGVAVTHRNVLRLLAATEAWFGFGRGDTWTLFHSFAFDFSVWELWGALAYGGRLVLVSQAESRSPELFWQLLLRHRVTVLNQTPSAFFELARIALAAPDAGSALEEVIFGGEALDLAALAPWLERQGERRPRLVNMYGITETTVHVTFRPLALADTRKGAGSLIGVPIPDLDLLVLDGALEPRPIGCPGELAVGGAGLARGYLGRPGLTAERFVPHPHAAAGARLYRSGDLARRLPSGDLDYLGRADQQVKIRGFRIELGEIEAELALHPAVARAVVVLRQEADLGKFLVGYWLARGEATVEDLREHLGRRLPAHMVPAVFQRLAALPLTTHGKVDRRALPAPERLRPELRAAYAAPRTAAERTLAEVWQQVLGHQQVGVNDNFFALGGDSIRTLQIAALARERGYALQAQQLFLHQTVAELAAGLEAAAPPSAPAPRLAAANLPPGIEEELPLAALQAGMLFHSRLAAEGSIYHDLFSYRLRAPFRAGALRRALDRETRRHAALRTSFELGGAVEPVARVHTSARLPVSFFDLTPLASRDQEAVLDAWMDGEKRRPFVLGVPPLARFAVHHLAVDEFTLSLSFHHAIVDGWSVATLLTELFTLYFAELAGTAVELPPLTVPYRSFLDLERAALASAEQRSFWHDLLAGSELTPLPRWPKSSAGTARRSVEVLRLELAPELGSALLAEAAARGLPVKSALLAAHVWAVASVSGSDDLITGLVSNGRTDEAGAERTLGLFLNTIPFRLELVAGESFWELAGRAFRAETIAFPHRRFPLADMQQSLGGRPLFETAFNFVHFHIYEGILGLPQLRVLAERFYEETNFALLAHFSLAPQSRTLGLELKYDASTFHPAEVQTFGRFYRAALGALAKKPGASTHLTQALEPGQLHQLLREWNDSTRDFGAAATLTELLVRDRPQAPDRVALECGDEALSDEELFRRATHLALRLRRLGVADEVRVGIALERSTELLVALFGTLLAGGAYVPLDPSYPAARLAFLLADSRPAVLLTSSAALTRLPAAVPAATLLLDREAVPAGPAGPPPPPPAPESLAYVIYTSGSTGQPKGAMNSQRAVANRLLWMQDAYRLGTGDRVLQKTPMSFDVSVWELFWPALVGATLVLARPEGHRDNSYLVRTIAERRVTVVHFVPSMLRAFLEHPAVAAAAGLCWLITSGEALPLALVQSCRNLLPARLENLYGPTEAAVDVTVASGSTLGHGGVVPIGRPIANLEVHLLNRHRLAVPVAVPAEIFLGGCGLGRGYLLRPALTAERFVPAPEPLAPGARLYRTGDLGRRLPGGEIEYLGRLDQQVKVRGMRIELGAIEAALRRHPAVLDAAVAVAGSGDDRRLVGFWVARESAAEGAEELRDFLARELPAHEVPEQLAPVTALPLSPSGKLDRRALPLGELPGAAEREHVPPVGAVAELAATVWAEVLGRERISAEDDFFALGGHSLAATRACARLEALLGVEVPVRELFDAPRLGHFARRLEAARATGSAPPWQRVERGCDLAASFAQERLWFVERLLGGSPAYNIPIAFHITGGLRAAALTAALGAEVERHETLRSRFVAVAGAPRVVIEPPRRLAIPLVDVSRLDPAAAQGEERALLARAARRPFDLARCPLLAAYLLRTAPAAHCLLLNLHHIVADGWSLSVLARELTALYAQAVAGGAPSLPPLPWQYVDFSAWQRQLLCGERLAAELAAWRELLAGSPTTLELPTDRPRGPVATFNGATREFALPAGLAAPLARLCRREGVTPFMVLLGAFQLLLGRLSGQAEVVVGSPVAGRTQPETEAMIGFFVNSLVLRGDLAGAPTGRSFLARVRAMALAAYAHQDLPFELLVQELKPEREPSRAPVFQVMFALQNAPLAAIDAAGLSFRPLVLDTGTAKLDWTFSLTELDGRFVGTAEYNRALFDATTLERAVRHFTVLVTALVGQPELRISELPLLAAAERWQLAGEWNDTPQPFAGDVGLPALFAEQAAARVDAIALDYGTLAVSYGELRRASASLAAELGRRGVGSETAVVVLLERSPAWVMACLAILEAGGFYVPLDPGYPPERLRFMLADCQAPAVVSRPELAAELGVDPIVPRWLDGGTRGGASPDRQLRTSLAPDALAYVIYTSGSTGRPKGVAVPQGAVIRLVRSTNYVALASSVRLAQASNASFDAATFELWGALLSGGRLIGVEPGEALSPRRLAGLLREKVVTSLFVTTALLNQLVRAMPAIFATLEELLFGGEAVDPGPVRQALAAGGPRRLLHVYGPTENTTFSTFHPVRAVAPGARTIAIGQPLGNSTALVYERGGALAPVGVPAELYLGGAGLARGYFRRPALTAARFVPQPDARAPGARLYRTGDLVRWLADGSLEFLGRLDGQVKLRGFRIELAELELVLAAHPAIEAAVAVVRDDGGDRALVAYFVSRGAAPPVAELKEYLGRHLPAFMIPASFVPLTALPLGPNGKVDRRELPAPAGAEAELAANYVAPRTANEQQLARLWCEALHLPQVGIHDNFFDLGGHSLLVTRLHAELEALLAREIPLVELFQYPTIAALAARLEQPAAASATAAPAQGERRRQAEGAQEARRQQRIAARQSGGRTHA